MKISILTIILLTFWTDLFYGGGVLADDGSRCRGNDCKHTATAIRVQLLKGTPSRVSPHRSGPDNEPGIHPNIVIGPPGGPIRPSSPAINLTSLVFRHTENVITNGCGGRNIAFGKDTIFGTQGIEPSEPSGAKAGNVIFTTANQFASISTNGGLTFNVINPTVYSGPANPSTDGGFCCDQVVQYIPSIDRFVWLIQYWPNLKNVNKLRLIIFRPSDVNNSGIKSWFFVDIFSTSLKLIGQLDFGDLAVGTSHLYISATNTGTGLVVMRVAIADLIKPGPLTLWYTDPTIGAVAYLSRLSQNPGNAAFWAGHSVLGTTMTVFKWPAPGTTYFWSDIRINNWPAGPADFVSLCPKPSTTNWLFNVLFHRIIGATRRTTNEVWFAWHTSKGGGFPNVHIQIAQINVSKWPNLSLIKQWQIWNPNFAFAYPSLYTNACSDVGLAVAFGGGPFDPSSAVGIADSNGVLTQTVYYPELSGVCENRFGDYLTVRNGNGRGFAGFVYAEQLVNSAIQRRPRYLEFGRV